MSETRRYFENALRTMADVEVKLWKDTELMSVFFRQKEFAHFHNDREIDIRLSRRFIKKENLVPLAESKAHPNRSKSSRWMVFGFNDYTQVEALLGLISRLIDEEYKDTDWGKS